MPLSKPRDGREFVRIAVTLPSDPKLLDTADAPRCGWLFVCGLTYAREHRTDGVLLPAAVIREAGVPKRLAAELVRVGMWHEPGHTCDRCPQPPDRHVVVHDYGLHNQTRDEIEALREAGRAAATARWSKPTTPTTGTRKASKPRADSSAVRTADRNANRICDPHTEAEVEVEVQTTLLTFVSRLAGSDARVDTRLPAELIDAWQDYAGPLVDLEREAGAYLRHHADRPARDERAAWLGWLRKARERAEQAPRAPGCATCDAGWLPPLPDDPLARPRRCPTCRPPHLRAV